MKNKRQRSKADILLVAAFLVAIPRFMGVFAAAIGVDLVRAWGWFGVVEVWSGLFMAMLEGLALAYISKRWRRLPAGSGYWKLLLGFQAVLILALPLTVTPYLVATQMRAPVIEVLPAVVFWLWNFLIAATSPFIATAVGLVDSDSDDETPAISERLRAWDMLMQHGGMTPLELSEMLGGGCTPDVAEGYIETWVDLAEKPRRKNGR